MHKITVYDKETAKEVKENLEQKFNAVTVMENNDGTYIVETFTEVDPKEAYYPKK